MEKRKRICMAMRRLEAFLDNAHEPHDKWICDAVFRKIDELSARYGVVAFSSRGC